MNSKTGISRYFDDIGKEKLLSFSEEKDLAYKYRDGDMRSRDILIKKNLRLVVSIAKKYIKYNKSSIEDLVQEGNIGLMKAVEKYDPDKGYRFSTYATWWVRQKITRYIQSHSRTIRVPSHVSGINASILSETEKFEDQFGCKPTDAELAEAIGVNVSSIKAARESRSWIVSLDKPKFDRDGDSSGSLEGFLENDDESAVDKIQKTNLASAIKKALNKLTDREQKVLRLRFGISESNDSKEFLMSREEELNLMTEELG